MNSIRIDKGFSAFSYPIRFLFRLHSTHVAVRISTSGREMRADIAAFKAENVGEPLEVFLQWRKESEGLSCWDMHVGRKDGMHVETKKNSGNHENLRDIGKLMKDICCWLMFFFANMMLKHVFDVRFMEQEPSGISCHHYFEQFYRQCTISFEFKLPI